jgi:hypothetical protein
MALTSNLPPNIAPQDSASDAKKFFNTYYEKQLSVSSNAIDATIGFFQNRGFELTAAQSVAGVLLSQSKIENINVFQLLDTLKGLNEVQLSRVVTEILNYNRERISTLGYRIDTAANTEYEKRNIMV